VVAAFTANSNVECVPVFSRAFLTCASTVRGDTQSALAMSVCRLPCANSCTISRSRFVNFDMSTVPPPRTIAACSSSPAKALARDK
jgi:hypothetical protein